MKNNVNEAIRCGVSTYAQMCASEDTVEKICARVSLEDPLDQDSCRIGGFEQGTQNVSQHLGVFEQRLGVKVSLQPGFNDSPIAAPLIVSTGNYIGACNQ